MTRLATSILVIAIAIGAGATIFWLSGAGSAAYAADRGGLLLGAFALTALLTTMNLVLRWGRWHFLVRRFDLRVQTRDSLRLYFATLPAIATPFSVGELIRAPLLSGRFPGARPALYYVWFTERLTDATVLLLVLLIARQQPIGAALACAGWIALVGLTARVASAGALPRIDRPVVLAVLFGSSLFAWLLPIAALETTLRLLGGPGGFFRAADAMASGTLLGGIAGIPLGMGVLGSTAIVTLEGHGTGRDAAVAATAVFRAGTAWFAVGLGALVLLVARRALAELVRPAFAPDHFDRIAAGYRDQIPAHVRERLLARKTRVMEPWLARGGIGPGGRLLDVGCGHGWYACEMARRGYRVTAFDVSADQVAEARTYAAEQGVEVDFRVLDAAALPFSDEAFDAAYSVNVLHHIVDPEARRRTFDEIVRVLRPGGLFFLHEINTQNPLFRFYMGYVFPLLCDIDEGTERWIRPSALPEVAGARWEPEVDYFTFLPDFTPRRVLEAAQELEAWLERSPLRSWSAHYMARLTRR